MLEKLKQNVFEANKSLVEHNLVVLTWGNVSAIDKETNLVVIKPSGVDYAKMSAEDIVVVDLDGKVVDGHFNPSSDLATHLELYKKYPEIGGVVHTHSLYATAFSQAQKEIVCFGTTHADTFYGTIPVTRELTKSEIEIEYEKNTGMAIIEKIGGNNVMQCPAILVANHAPFTWGKSAEEAVVNAIVLEEVAKMAQLTLSLNSETKEIQQHLQDKHYLRKHGKNAYYGQKSKEN